MEAYCLSNEDYKGVFRFLEEEEARLLCNYTELKKYAAHEIVMTEGENSNWMGFLLQGRLKVKKETSFPGKFVLVAILERGTMVGELSAIDGSKRTATVEVLEDCRILHLSTAKIESLLSDHPQLGMKFLKWIIHIAGIRIRKAVDRMSKLL